MSAVGIAPVLHKIFHGVEDFTIRQCFLTLHVGLITLYYFCLIALTYNPENPPTSAFNLLLVALWSVKQFPRNSIGCKQKLNVYNSCHKPITLVLILAFSGLILIPVFP